MEEEGKGKMKRQGDEYDCDLHSGRKYIGSTLELFECSARLTYVAHHADKLI